MEEKTVSIGELFETYTDLLKKIVKVGFDNDGPGVDPQKIWSKFCIVAGKQAVASGITVEQYREWLEMYQATHNPATIIGSEIDRLYEERRKS